MDVLHLHLLLNHVPVIGIPIGAALLAWGLMRAQRAVQRAGLAVLLMMALAAVPVFFTGEPAEERVEHLPGVASAMIERHESAGEQAMIAAQLVWIAAAAALFMSRRQRPLARPAGLAVLVIATVAAGVMARAGYLGGQIRHTELGTAAPAAVEDEEHH